MAPPAALADLESDSPPAFCPPTKKAKVSHKPAEDREETVIRHPLGVRPAGNALLAKTDLRVSTGSFALLPDELIAVLLEYLEATDLLRLGASCRALFAYTRNDELWRAIFTESSPDRHFDWRGTWRSTFLNQSHLQEPRVDCSNLFSDVLHRPFLCAHVPLEAYATNIPKSNLIQRLDDCDPFTAFKADRPLILTNSIKKWPIYSDWTVETLLRDYSDVRFRAEAVDWPLSTYVSYMRSNADESPLYLFDRSFASKMALSIGPPPSSYQPPPAFGTATDDLFTLLGPQRPDHAWLIIGPARSGSTFHKDPNNTSAWNAVIRGAKYWIMFPSSASLPPPPGVYVSADQSEVTSPLSIAEWLLTFHAEARATPGCKEGICGEGEVLYVPAGWYHLVLNLEESIAVTQNFVPRHGLADVLAFLRDRPEQVTGFRDVADPYGLFVERLREKEPALLEDALGRLERRERARGKWEEITKVAEEEGQSGGFSFGFGGDDDEDVP